MGSSCDKSRAFQVLTQPRSDRDARRRHAVARGRADFSVLPVPDIHTRSRIMALNVILQLANGEGLMKILVFTGLSHSLVVHPTIHGEPLLTAQAFYYLEELESVAQLRYEAGEPELSEEDLEYLVDNYLFEYSKTDPQSKMTFKVTRGKFWKDDPSEMYILADQGHTEALALDMANDPSVKSIQALDSSDSIDLSDWRIGHNYVAETFQNYVNSICSVFEKKVSVVVFPSEGRDGYLGRLRVIKPGYGLIDFFQGEALENISIRSISPSATTISLGTSKAQTVIDSLPVERIATTKQHRPILLSHYFSGLKEDNPLKSYLGFYNVLEYYFEEAPVLLGRSANTEREQLSCVLELLTTDADIRAFICRLDAHLSGAISATLLTSSGVAILGFTPATLNDHRSELTRWLYEIRCAIVHSKKTRKGRPAATFEPYSSEAKNVGIALPFVRWLAILCIEKDYALRATP